ncbi:MAG: ATP-binding protein [Synergistetes bacterium]|nr:ATP-binding protein [Synergistota bacterium]
MEELALHIIDLVENSVSAGASLIKVIVEISEAKDKLKMVVEDNGKGMSEEEAKCALDPFITTKSGKKVGLGIPLLAQTAELCGGELKIESEKGKGTKVIVEMRLKHIDRPPLGDFASTFFTLVFGHSDIDFLIKVKTDYGEMKIDTTEIKKAIGREAFSHPEVISFMREKIERELNDILKGGKNYEA